MLTFALLLRLAFCRQGGDFVEAGFDQRLDFAGDLAEGFPGEVGVGDVESRTRKLTEQVNTVG